MSSIPGLRTRHLFSSGGFMVEEVERYGRRAYRYQLSQVCSVFDLMLSHYYEEAGGFVRFIPLKTKRKFN
ncbi:MAG TPA: hypothetical protein VEA37_04085, partial [Flavobacterium sp.]|nr:hypothetical protein [Flavobacterium sp.]